MASEKRLIDPKKALYLAEHSGLYDFDLSSLEILLFDEPCITVDAVEVVHGRWEDEYGGAFTNPRYRCSVCKGKALYRHEQNSLGGWEAVQALTDYCPNCGAKMDGGNGDE